MNRFLYKAKDRTGHDVSGALVAQSEEVAVARLQQAGYYVTEITPELRIAPPPGPPKALGRMFPGVTSGDLAVMFRELATMVGAGMSLVRALDVLERNTSKPRLRQAIRDAQRGVEHGEPLSLQLRRYEAIFPELAAATVEAAERSGHLDTMLRMVADYLEYEHELRQTIRRETLYPKIVFAVIILVLLILTGISVWQAGGSWFLTTTTILVQLAAIIGGVWLGMKLLSTSTYARQVWDGIKLHLPIIGKTVRRLVMSRFARALATMYEAGLSLPEGVRLSARACGNHYVASALEPCIHPMQRGMKLSEVLAGTGVVPNMVLQMVVTGEESGELGSTLNKVAEYCESEAKTSIHAMCVSILPIALIMLGLVVLLVAIRFYVGYVTSLLNV